MRAELAVLVERLWVANRARTLDRLRSVVDGLDALAGSRPADVARITGEAHVLAGSLGTYGRPGSDLLKRTEAALAAGVGPGDAAALAAELRALAERLAVS